MYASSFSLSSLDDVSRLSVTCFRINSSDRTLTVAPALIAAVQASITTTASDRNDIDPNVNSSCVFSELDDFKHVFWNKGMIVLC